MLAFMTDRERLDLLRSDLLSRRGVRVLLGAPQRGGRGFPVPRRRRIGGRTAPRPPRPRRRGRRGSWFGGALLLEAPPLRDPSHRGGGPLPWNSGARRYGGSRP